MPIRNQLDKLQKVLIPNMWWKQLSVAWAELNIKLKRINSIRCLPVLWLAPAVRWVLLCSASDLQQEYTLQKQEPVFFTQNFHLLPVGTKSYKAKHGFFGWFVASSKFRSDYFYELTFPLDTNNFCIAKQRLWKGVCNQFSAVSLLLEILILS